MDSIVDWLLDQADSDNSGPYWTYAVAPGDAAPAGTSGTAGLPARTAWCYGSPGIARPVACRPCPGGNPLATARPGSAAGSTRTSGHRLGVHDGSLCHGWAGLLQIVTLMARSCPDAGLEPAVDHLAAQALSAFDAASPFGFRQHLPSGSISRPGFWKGLRALLSRCTGTPGQHHPAPRGRQRSC
ncbi:lanthionine synthetase LanC family protein [Streptomyces triculaminicus]|uniref:lanthionine synthetase LanC family protein n=1 Tax=Streptomyces triculaminicus TaxID=2816232 RepID=UPI0037CDC286